jgi:hypothetical protein
VENKTLHGLKCGGKKKRKEKKLTSPGFDPVTL